ESILPCIVTSRPTCEGGTCDLPEPTREHLLLWADLGRTRFIDVELKAIQRGFNIASLNFVVSSHDFTGRPDRLYNIIAEMNALPAAVNKVAWTARTIRDNIEALEILQSRQRFTIALCMGESGLLSRVLAKKFGAYLTFASLRDESATAPGQVTIDDMKR